VRYIGAFTLLVVNIFWFFNWFKYKRLDLNLLVTQVVVSLSICAYLTHNFYQKGMLFTKGSVSSDGFITTVQSYTTLLGDFLWAFIKSATLPMVNKFSWPSVVIFFFIFQFFLISIIYRYQAPFSSKPFSSHYILWRISLFSSFIYLFLLFTIRFLLALDDFGYRYLAPFSFLFFIGLLDYFQDQKPFYFKLASKFLVVMAIISFSLNCPVKHLYNYWFEEKPQTTFPAHISKLKKQYSFVTDTPTAVAFGNPALDYRKMNVVTPTPISIAKSPQSAQPMDSFLEELKTFPGEVYIKIKKVQKLDGPYHYHPSVNKFMKSHSSHNIVKLK
jgi:hypothetical protein